jgi:hypothetical protein
VSIRRYWNKFKNAMYILIEANEKLWGGMLLAVPTSAMIIVMALIESYECQCKRPALIFFRSPTSNPMGPFSTGKIPELVAPFIPVV